MSQKNKNKDKFNQTQEITKKIKKSSAYLDQNGVLIFTKALSVSDLAKVIHKTPQAIINYFSTQGEKINNNQILDVEEIGEVCLNLGIDFLQQEDVTFANLLDNLDDFSDDSAAIARPPVVTIMGHVDHGKTTLLDVIRSSRVVEKEAGGITQHIGSYQIKINKKAITFIDTPGHEAFTEMRAHGSKITDIVVLVVAADDGVMPQTKEAIDHAQNAQVPIIVFVNKMDKPNVNVERILNDLATHNLISEEWGGNTIFVYGSALKNNNIDELLETILLVADLQDLKANPNRHASGVIIETHFDKNMGSISTLLVQNGTLKQKDIIASATAFGKIKKMVDDLGKIVPKATPSMPVQVLGFETMPQPGERFFVFDDEKIARKVIEANKIKAAQQSYKTAGLEDVDDRKQINLIIKADTQGSAQAIQGALSKMTTNEVRINIVRAAVGGISESDIKLALVSNSIVCGFNIRPNNIVREAASNAKVEVRLYRIIYELIEDLEAMIKGLHKKDYGNKVLGMARIVRTFQFSKIGTIAGCVIVDGTIPRNAKINVLRDDVIIYTGEIGTLKRQKEDLKVATKGTECGITVKNFNDLKENDMLEAYVVEEIEKNDKA